MQWKYKTLYVYMVYIYIYTHIPTNLYIYGIHIIYICVCTDLFLKESEFGTCLKQYLQRGHREMTGSSWGCPWVQTQEDGCYADAAAPWQLRPTAHSLWAFSFLLSSTAHSGLCPGKEAVLAESMCSSRRWSPMKPTVANAFSSFTDKECFSE